MNNECEVLNRLKKADDLIMEIYDKLNLSRLKEYPTKEDAHVAMKYTYERCQWMNRCMGYENPMAYITDDSALTNESSGNTIKLWIKKNNRKRSWLKNAKKLDDIERETGEKLAKEFGFESVSELNKFIEMVGQNKTK